MLYVILGLMYDGKAWNGYRLATTFEEKSRAKANRPTFYVKLAELREKGLVRDVKNPTAHASGPLPDAAGRFDKPCQITDQGRREFEAWLFSPMTLRDDLRSWLLFLQLVPPDTLDALLHRQREHAWLTSKSLANQLEYDQAASRLNGGGYDPRSCLLRQEWHHACAELETIEEIQREVERLRSTGALSR